MVEAERDKEIDIIRGIGIASIVIGHAFNTDNNYSYLIDFIRKFFYIFNIIIFFWCAGYCYKKRDPKSFFKKLFYNHYLRTTLVCLFSLSILPLFYYLHVVKIYDTTTILKKITLTLIYLPSGVLTGSFWFMPFFTGALILFYFTMKLNTQRKYIVCLTFGILGTYLVYRKMEAPYHFFKMLCVQPIILLGWLCKKTNIKLFYDKIRGVYFVIFAFAIAVINYATNLETELSKNLVYGFWGFYPMCVIGILFCISLARAIRGGQHQNKFVCLHWEK